MQFATGVIIAVGLLVAYAVASIAASPGPFPQVEPPEPVAEQVPDMPRTHTVDMAEGSGVLGCEETNSCYEPWSLDVSSGDTISWVNLDSAAHTVSSTTDGKPDGVFDSGLVLAGDSFQFTFEDPGEYPYFCIVHPWMEGIIRVN